MALQTLIDNYISAEAKLLVDATSLGKDYRYLLKNINNHKYLQLAIINPIGLTDFDKDAIERSMRADLLGFKDSRMLNL